LAEAIAAAHSLWRARDATVQTVKLSEFGVAIGSPLEMWLRFLSSARRIEREGQLISRLQVPRVVVHGLLQPANRLAKPTGLGGQGTKFKAQVIVLRCLAELATSVEPHVAWRVGRFP